MMEDKVPITPWDAERIAENLVEAFEDLKAAKRQGLQPQKLQATFSIFRSIKAIMRSEANWEEE